MYSKSFHSGQWLQSTIKQLLFIGLVSGTFCIPAIGWSADVNEFIDFSLLDGETVLLPGRLYEPPGADSSLASRPLVLFLHGNSVVGSDNVSQVTHPAIDPVLADAKERGAYLYAPQTPTDWGDVTVTTRSAMMLDNALAEKNVEVDRLYSAGASLGGAGVWNFLNRYPDYFAASVSIASHFVAGDFSATNLVGEPIWTYHNRHDPVTLVTNTRNVVSGILTAEGEPLPTYPPLSDTETWFEYHHEALDLHYAESPADVHGGPDAELLGEMFDWLYAHGVVPGDFDLDGDVDGTDFLSWQRGESPDPLSASDLADWQANYAAPETVAASNAGVPEPTALLLAASAGLGLLISQRNR